MKTLLISYKFLFLTLMSIPLAMCSNDDDQDENQTPFEPINITFYDEMFTDCDETVNIEDVKITYRKKDFDVGGENDSEDNGECSLDFFDHIDLESRLNHPFENEYRIFLASYLEIDFSDLVGVSKIILEIEDACGVGCTGAKLYSGNTTIQTIENSSVGELEEFVFENLTNTNKVNVYSYEGFIYKIRVE